MTFLSIILGILILITVIGNVFVIAAIVLERNLQNVANYLVASLAVADLMVACLVMPLSAVYEISSGWILGPELCDFWTSCDVLCCTASILHLVAIALDRYWAVTNVDYIHSRTSNRVFLMIFLVWFVSIIVSLAPQFGWKDPEYLERIEEQKCMISQDISYQVFATMCTFYVPLLVILVLYWKIFQTARRRIRRRKPKAKNMNIEAGASQRTTIIGKKKKSRLGFTLTSKFSKHKDRSAAISSSLGLVDGNSTNTVNTMEDIEDIEKIKVTQTAFTKQDMKSELITTVSHQVHNKLNVIETENALACNNNNNTNNNNNSESTSSNTTCVNNEQTNQIGIKSPLDAVAGQKNHSIIQQQQQQEEQLQQQNKIYQDREIDTITKSISSSHLETVNSELLTPVPEQKSIIPIKKDAVCVATTSAVVATPTAEPKPPSSFQDLNKRKETMEAKRERKAARTLTIITSAFVICWLPFFMMALLLPLFDIYISDVISSIFLWLGYFNSTINPIIYTIFSPEFRSAFQRILFGSSHKTSHYRRKL
ncbi:unnamed protein product [Diamesa tonsa]